MIPFVIHNKKSLRIIVGSPNRTKSMIAWNKRLRINRPPRAGAALPSAPQSSKPRSISRHQIGT
jgi:hypothetical protein